MSTPMNNDIERAYAQFEASKRAIGELRGQLRGGTTTATSRNRALTVTVDGHGELSEIKFLTRSYRIMPSIELAALLVETIGEARRLSLAKATEAFQAVLPAGLPLAELVGGDLDIGQLMDGMIAADTGRTAPEGKR
jgi:YbaB/EbfC DNA-binding family